MKRVIFALIAALLLAILPACNQAKEAKRKEMGGTYEPIYRDGQTDTRASRLNHESINGEERLQGGGQNEIGYFRYSPENYRGTNGNGQAPGPDVLIDRTLLAKHVAHLVTILPNVKDATALVTDDHIFVGVHPKNGTLDAKTLKEAKRTAESVTPRYYKVHVTSDDKLQSQINSVGMRMRGSHDVEGVKGDLEQLLRKMGDDTPPDVNESKHPQGRDQINPEQD